MATRLLFSAAALWTAGTASDHYFGGELKVLKGETVSAEPLGAIISIHMFIQLLAYGVIFPIGVVFGLSKSYWHVPTQIFGTALAIMGFFLGRAHTSRHSSGNSVHASFAWILQFLLATQVVLGIFLKRLYLKGNHEKSTNEWISRLTRRCHSVLGKAMTVLAWTQLLFGGITALGSCQGDYICQCATQFIMGSAFFAYGALISIIILSRIWLRRSGRS